ncbi:MAG: CGNR zinc finger domain-containing protein [Frankiaceae bacterium]
MLFAHDTEVALTAAAALVNTEQDDDELADVPALDLFLQAWGWTGKRRGNHAELDDVRTLRPRLRRLWYVDEDSAVALVNDLLREAGALPQLVKHDGWGYHVHATPSHAPLAERMAVEAAMAFTDVIRQGELARLQVCAADGCDDVLVDLSKNRSRRFCGTSCANRTNVAAFRARRRTP